jgi:hypothetical protein
MNKFIIFIFLLVSTCSYAQIIQFDKDFNQKNNEKLPYGELVKLVGEIETGVKYDTIIVSVNFSKFGKENVPNANVIHKIAIIEGNQWNVLIDPLPANTSVFFDFKLIKQVTNDHKKFLISKVKSALLDINYVPISSGDQLTKYLNESLTDNLTNSFDGYYIKNGISLKDYTLKIFNEINLSTKVELVNNIIDIYDFAKLNDSSFFNKPTSKQFDFVDFKPDFSDKSKIDTITLKKMYFEGFNSDKSIVSKQHYIDSVFNLYFQKLELYFSKSYHTSFISKSLETNELLKYASFDISSMVFPQSKMNRNEAYVGYFFTVSPYLFCKKNNICDIFPTVGLGLSSSLSDIKQPFYYIGLSFRLNKIFNATVGTSIFKKSNSQPEFEWMPGIGISLKIIHLADFLKLVNSVKNSVD